MVAGVLAWGLVVALGLGALLALSGTLYTILQYAGAAYLLWLGLCMVRAALKSGAPSDAASPALPSAPSRSGNWFMKGLLANLLNPKMGVFYVSFLPQFVPAGASVLGFSLLLAVPGLGAWRGLYQRLRMSSRAATRPTAASPAL